MKLLTLVLAAGVFAGTADAKTLVYTYQGKPLEIQIPDPEQIDAEMHYYLSLMPAVIEGIRVTIKVDKSKPNSSGINFEGNNYCEEADCQFFGPAVKLFDSNYVSVPGYVWSVINLNLSETGVEGDIFLDSGRYGVSVYHNIGDMHWRPLDAPDDQFSSYDVVYRSSAFGEWSVATVPIPATGLLLLTAGGALIAARRRKA